MHKYIFLIFLVFYSFRSWGQAPNTWVRKNDFSALNSNSSTARAEAVSFSIGTKGYVGTGFDGTNKKNDFWEYDPFTNTWTQKAALPGPGRDRAVAFSIGSKGYVGTGSDSSNTRLNDFWEYDPVTNTWTAKANFAGTPRKGAVAFVINNKGYIGTGNDLNGNRNDFWEYDPVADSWTLKAPYPGLAITEGAGFGIGAFGYIGTGNTLKSFYEYNPASNSWRVRASYPGLGVVEVLGFSINNKGYFCSGKVNQGPVNDVYEYDPLTNSWTLQSSILLPSGATGFSIGSRGYVATGWALNTGYRTDLWEIDQTKPLSQRLIQRSNMGARSRSGAVGFSIANKGYIGTGTDGFFRKDFWEYDPISETWQQKANFPGGSREKAIGFGIGVKGYLGAGIDSLGNKTDDFWEYDPLKNQWTEKAQVPNAGHNIHIGFSILNKGYVYGGFLGSNFMEYNPQTDTWTNKANFPGVPRNKATGFAIGNKGYVGLGADGVGYRNDFWEYNPASDSWLQKTNYGGFARTDVFSFGIGNKGFIGAGYSGTGTYFAEFWEYDQVTNIWTQKAIFPGIGREKPVSFSIGTKGYAGLGYSRHNQFLPDFWEYTPQIPPVKDVGISAITSLPANDCGLGSQQTITVSIMNLGSQPETNIPVGYQVNGITITPIPEICTDTIPPNGTTSFTFAVPANLNNPGTYIIKPFTVLPNDSRTFNDTASFKIINRMLAALPDFDFETPTQNLANFRIVRNHNNNIFSLTGQGLGFNSSGALIMVLNGNFNFVTTGNVWDKNAERIGGAYLCFNPSGGTASDSLWLTFDLKQHFHNIPLNTNFRVTANGQQVSPTYNPPTAGSSNTWNHYKVDLTQFKNLSSLEIGFESLLNIEFYNNTDPRNFVDNIKVVRKLGNTTGLNQGKEFSDLIVYPNPTYRQFFISSTKTNQEMELIDMSGKVILKQKLHNGNNLINLPKSAQGLYLVKVISQEGVKFKKLIVQ